MEVPYHVDVLGDIADNITLGNLLMIDIEEELAVLAVDSLEHSYCFFGCYKEVSLVVNKNVERLENYHNALFFSDVGHFRESLYAYLKLFFAGHVKSFVAGCRDDVRNVHSLSCGNGFTECFDEGLSCVFPYHAVAPLDSAVVLLICGLDDDSGRGNSCFVECLLSFIKVKTEPTELFYAVKTVTVAKLYFVIPVRTPPTACC